jgi:hypothetical protein
MEDDSPGTRTADVPVAAADLPDREPAEDDARNATNEPTGPTSRRGIRANEPTEPTSRRGIRANEPIPDPLGAPSSRETDPTGGFPPMVELPHQPGYSPSIHDAASVRPQIPDMTAGSGPDCVQVANATSEAAILNGNSRTRAATCN